MKVSELIEYLNIFGNEREVKILVSGDSEPYETLDAPEYDEDLNAVVIVVS